MNGNKSALAVGAVLVALFGSQYLVHAADTPVKAGSFLITSSTATNNVTDLWILDQSTRTLYLCRAGGSSATAPTCTKGAQLP